MVESGGHLWFPLDVLTDTDSEVVVDNIVAQAEGNSPCNLEIDERSGSCASADSRRPHRPKWLDGKTHGQTIANATGRSIEPPPTAPSQRRLLGVVEEGGDLCERDVGMGQIALGEVAPGFVL